MKVTSLYICPWSLDDPLTKTQTLAYLRELTPDGHNFALLTFENSKFLMSAEAVDAAKKDLAAENIFWHPVYWSSGNSIFDKLSSARRIYYTAIKVYFKHKPEIIHSRGSLPLFLSLALRRIGRSRFLYDADAILSEEYADVGHLARDSSGFRLLARFEAAARRSADRMIVLTETIKNDFIEKYALEKNIEVIPCCVDTEKFRFSESDRKTRRAQLNLTDERLFIYVGKYGTWYLVEEMLDFFKAALATNPSAKLLILTQESPAAFEKLFAEKNIGRASYFIEHASHAEVAEWLSAADVGLAFIKPVGSKRGTSPVKTSEYLASGLPIVGGAGIGDLDAVITENNVGAVMPQFTAECYAAAVEKVDALLRDENLRARCGEVAFKEFDLYNVGGVKYRRIYKEILSGSG